MAVLSADDRVRLVAVTIDGDDGTDLTVSGGLALTDRLLLNASEAIEEGWLVQATADPVDKARRAAGDKLPLGDKLPTADKPTAPNATQAVGFGTGIRATQQP